MSLGEGHVLDVQTVSGMSDDHFLVAGENTNVALYRRVLTPPKSTAKWCRGSHVRPK
jgi:hypothetical protein